MDWDKYNLRYCTTCICYCLGLYRWK